MKWSTLDSFAAGLLYDNLQNGYGFDLFVKCLESSEADPPTRHFHLQAEETWQSYLKQAVVQLLQKRDAHGRTLLHYVAAYDVVNTDFYLGKKGYEIVCLVIRSEYKEAGKEFPYEWRYLNDSGDNEELGLGVTLWWKKRQKQTLSPK